MADTRLSDLSAAGALSASDLFYVVQTPGSGGEKATGTQLLALVGTAYVPLAGGASMVGPLSIVNSTTQQIAYVYNTFTDASNYERLTLTGVAGTSVNITAETLGTGGDNLNLVLTPAGTGSVFLGSFVSVNTSGALTAPGIYLSSNVGSWVNNKLKLKKEAILGWSSTYSVADAYDTAFYKSVAGRIDVMDGITDTAFRDLKLRNLIQTEYHEVAEMTAPAAPATNSVRIYAEDNGAGKTRLMALFASGAAQQIAIEP